MKEFFINIDESDGVRNILKMHLFVILFILFFKEKNTEMKSRFILKSFISCI